jgi:hypothetical protein
MQIRDRPRLIHEQIMRWPGLASRYPSGGLSKRTGFVNSDSQGRSSLGTC